MWDNIGCFVVTETIQTFAQDDVDSCPICLCELNDKIKRKTYCGHIFCKSCIYEWVGNHSCTCPACRTKISKYNVADAYDPSLDSTPIDVQQEGNFLRRVVESASYGTIEIEINTEYISNFDEIESIFNF